MAIDLYSANEVHLRDDKIRIRETVIDLFSKEEGTPTFLTFPGSNWLTEQGTIINRQMDKRLPCTFYGLEFKYETYLESLNNLPEILDSEGKNIAQISLRNTDFDSYVIPWQLTSAWLDFIGGSTYYRTAKISKVWEHISSHLVLTISYRTCHSELAAEIAEVGMAKFYQQYLPNSEVIEDFAYNNRPKMHHMVFRRVPCVNSGKEQSQL